MPEITEVDYLTILSHELRTPLNGIIGFSQMLELEPLSYEQTEMVKIIKNASNTLLHLINEILEISKHEAGMASYEKINFDLDKVISGTLKPYKILAEEKNLIFTIKKPANCHKWVIGDPVRLTQIFNNLLSNALKFTHQGFVEAEYDVKHEAGRLKLEISISDSGIGIKDEVKPMLFKSFIQGQENIARAYGGTGLGLAICRQIVEAMDGTIEVESTYRMGTRFMVNLYLDPQEERSQKTVAVSETEGGKRSGRVLVVEDNVTNQKLMVHFLKRYNIDFDLAGNGQEACQWCCLNDYDIIFMDCLMPVMDGYEAAKKIRGLLGNSVRIAAMTAHVSYEEQEKCFSAGMDKFLAKPINLPELSMLLGIESEFQEDINSVVFNSNEDIRRFYARELSKKIGFDYETCLELIDTFIIQGKSVFKEIDILKQEMNDKAISRLIHQLKGAAGTVRLEFIRLKLEKVETMLKTDMTQEAYRRLEEIMEEPIFEQIEIEDEMREY